MTHADLVARLSGYNPPDRTVDEYRQVSVDIHAAADAITSQATALRSAAREIERLREAIGFYGWHTHDCDYRAHKHPYKCTCGYEAALTPQGGDRGRHD